MLYNSRTLYDAFENPSQKAFSADSSFKYAFNFFIPVMATNGSISGPATNFFRKLLFENTTDLKQIDPLEIKANIVNVNTNIYLAMFRVFTDVNYNTEMGISWQIKNDTYATVANAAIALLDNENLFTPGTNYITALNGNSYSQLYHQFSFTYGKTFSDNRKIALGIKLSYLSGINYDAIETKDTYIKSDDVSLKLHTDGFYRSSHPYKSFNQNNIKDWLAPDFKNPGFAVTLSANFKLRKGWYLMTNIKDLGFIYWANAYEYKAKPFNFQLYPTPYNTTLADYMGNQLSDYLNRKSIISPINGKVEILVNKNLGAYQPNFILSKNILYPGGDVVLVNNYRFQNFILSASIGYNTNYALQLGMQAMIKSPNFEFFLGSNQLIRTYRSINGLMTHNIGLNKGTIDTSIYLGLGIKFGRVVYHQANSPYVP